MIPAGPLRKAARILQSGGVVAYPTESVYGLGCDPLDYPAVLRILAMKLREENAGLILLGADYEQISPFVAPSGRQLERMQATWPGPVTWVCPASSAAPPWITGGRDTIAVRVTDHPDAAALCAAAGMALVSTSANRSGRPAARSAVRVRRLFGQDVDYVVPGSVGGRPRPSEIRDAASGEVLRGG